MIGRSLAVVTLVVAAGTSCIIQNDDPCDPNPCAAGQYCLNGLCYPVTDPCVPNPCAAGQVCRDGLCYAADPCVPNPCAAGQVCRAGLCYADPCVPNPCPAGYTCAGGRCYPPADPCNPNPCAAGETCIGGTCYAAADPCNPNPCGAGQWCVNGYCYGVGTGCDFVDDQDCVNVSQAWWCAPDGTVRLNDCLEQCVATGMPYACCGYDPTRGDDACLCCAAADCSGLTCAGDPVDPCNPNPCGLGQWCVNGLCYGEGAACDFVNDQDCVNISQAWWCSPDGHVYLNDCVEQCAPYGMPYTCCGYDPTRGDDACLCCATADCSGFTCHG
jgi:hypothetical protein